MSGLLILTSVFSMDLPIKDQAKDIVQKMLECTRPIYEAKVEQVLNQGIFPEHSIFDYKRDSKLSDEADERFGMLADLCDSRHLPLLEVLLQSKKASANTSLILATGTRITLFTEAIDRSLKSASSKSNRFSAVELLLRYGADPNQESMSLSNRTSCEQYNADEKPFINTPLFRAISYFNENLVKLLLSHKALPDKYSQKISPLMAMTYHYNCCHSDYRFEDKMRAYKILQALLDKKADVLKPSTTPEGKIATPMQFAKDKKLSEIVALFEEYQQGKK